MAQGRCSQKGGVIYRDEGDEEDGIGSAQIGVGNWTKFSETEVLCSGMQFAGAACAKEICGRQNQRWIIF